MKTVDRMIVVSKTELTEQGFGADDGMVAVEMAMEKLVKQEPELITVAVPEPPVDRGDTFEVWLQAANQDMLSLGWEIGADG